jgi:hypothetical protein
MQVAMAALLAATAAHRDALRDVVAVLPVETVDWLDAPGGQRDGRDAFRDDRDVRRGVPAGCREDLCREDLADRPAGQAERRAGRVAYPDDRDARQAGPDECQGDLGHPDAMHREAA